MNTSLFKGSEVQTLNRISEYFPLRIVERLKDELAFLQGKVNDECKVKIREFQMLQTRFSKMSTFEPPQIYAAVMEEDDDPVK